MTTVDVLGVGVWTPDFPTADAWASQCLVPRSSLQPKLFSGSLQRRASTLAKMTAIVASDAAAMAGFNLSEVNFVYGSALGELSIASEIVAAFQDPGGLPSPTAFHHSVHNAPLASISIAVGNTLGSAAVAAGNATSGAALLEAIGLLEDTAAEAIAVFCDEKIPEAFAPWRNFESAAAAIALGRTPHPARLGSLQFAPSGETTRLALPGDYLFHPCAPALALVRAISRKESFTIDAAGNGVLVYCPTP